MKFSAVLAAASAGLALAAPRLRARQSNACFIIGDVELPQIVVDDVVILERMTSCDGNRRTLGGVPDVEVRGVTFSSVDFSGSDQSPLAFAMDRFATTDPLAENDLDRFQAMLAVYVATEAGMRSAGENVNRIKIPKFFLEFQVSRIGVAQGNEIPEAGMQVDHLLGKIQQSGRSEDQALLDRVARMARKLS